MQHRISNVPTARCSPDSSRARRRRPRYIRMAAPFTAERLEDRLVLSTLGVTATLTADNHYALYAGQADGSQLTLLGTNELGPGGAPGAFNWSLPETWTFSVGEGDYIYVLAWDDGGAQMWTGQFTL